VTALGALLIWAAFTNNGLAADQRRSIMLGLCRSKCRFNRIRIVAVYNRNNMPAIGRETLRRIIGKPTLNLTVN
jgi:hypothetical protein